MHTYCDACYKATSAGILTWLAGYWFCETCYTELHKLTEGLYICTLPEAVDLLWSYVKDHAKVSNQP